MGVAVKFPGEYIYMKPMLSHMKLSVALLLSAFLFLTPSCNKGPGTSDGFTIEGHIAGIENGKAVLAKLDLVSNEKVEVDSTDIRDGSFAFKGKVESPYLHTIFLNEGQDRINLFLENSEIQIVGDVNEMAHVKISGSREDSLFRSFGLDDIFDRKLGMDIMLNYPGYCFSAFTAYYQFQIFNISSDTMDLIMDGFSETVKESVYYEHLDRLYSTLRKVAISQPAPPFSIPDTSGNLVDLNQFRGSYVLIDFWASWCAPCRATNPKLVEVYEQYSHKNFTIIGISVDENESRWKDAIHADKLRWVNLSNLQGWDSVADSYGVKAIPQNFLIDPEGIIIDKNLEPEQLKEKLYELLADE
jgi:peroxiredoxin